MKHTTEVIEVIHKFELSDKEMNQLNDICKFYLKHCMAISNNTALAKEIIALVGPEPKIEMIHTEMPKVEDEEKIREDLGIVTVSSSRAAELLDKNGIFIGASDLIDSDETSPLISYEFNVIIGAQNQIGIKTLEGDFTWLNKNCAKLIKDFIISRGKGLYHRYAAYNNNGFLELELYIDNTGNSFHNGSHGKSLKLRYYNNGPFSITKDNRPEIILNYEQANILAKFISRHF